MSRMSRKKKLSCLHSLFGLAHTLLRSLDIFMKAPKRGDENNARSEHLSTCIQVSIIRMRKKGINGH